MSSYSAASWAATIFIVGAAVYIYRPDLIKRALPTSEHQPQLQAPTVKSAPKKQKSKKNQNTNPSIAAEDTGSALTSSTEARAAKKRKITAPVSNTVKVTTVDGEKTELPRNEDGNMGDKDFAQQLAKAQNGTKFQSSTQKKPVKTTKQSSAATDSAEQFSSRLGESSSAGVDGDDDTSSSASMTQHPVSGTNISDMLETPSAKPTSLRLTNIKEDEKKPKQVKQQFEQVQSKKKRNEQARREEQKRLREESDKIHEAKKQEQLRRARMAEGTSNQSKANAFNSAANAWQSSNQSKVKQAPAVSSAPLLDTFEPQSTAGPASGAVQSEKLSNLTSHPPQSNTANALREKVGEGKAQALAASNREQKSGKSWADQMSEEEQIQKIKEQEQEDAWEPVTSKKGKKKTRQESDSMSETSSGMPLKPTAPKTTTNGIKPNGTHAAPQTSNRFDFIQVNGPSNLADDEWEA